jgi:DNA polymerase-3 subunit delta
MIILLYGEDTYRSRKKLAEITEEHKSKHKSGLNLRYVDGKSANFDDLRSEMFEISMFREKKLIVLTDAAANAKFKEAFLEKGKQLADSENVLILYERQGMLKKDKLVSFIEKHGQVQEFLPLSGASLKKWTKEEFKKLGREIDEDALDLLLEFVAGDLWQMSNEIAKLSGYAPLRVKKEDVSAMVKPKAEVNIFETIDAIAVRDKKKAVDLLKNHIEKGDSPIYLLAMIASQMRNIISVKGLNGANPGMNPFVARKSVQQAKNFSLEDLKRIYGRISQLDTEIKVGKIDPDIVLDVLISEI